MSWEACVFIWNTRSFSSQRKFKSEIKKNHLSKSEVCMSINKLRRKIKTWTANCAAFLFIISITFRGVECWFSPTGSKYLWNLLYAPFTCTANRVENEYLLFLIALGWLLLTSLHDKCVWSGHLNGQKCYTTW